MIINTNVIIIGGGISGLSAAYHLNKKNIDFKLISEDIGGRIINSEDGNVQYGAYYIMNNYRNIKKFIQLGRRINLAKIAFHRNNETYSVNGKYFLKNIFQFVRFASALYKFKRHYEKFKKNCVLMSQKDALNKDAYLMKMYTTPASVFIKENKFNEITKYYLEMVIRGTTFTSIGRQNAFTFLQFSLPLIVPVYEFSFNKNKLIKDFNDQIIIDTVEKISNYNDSYIIETAKNTYSALKVIVATAPNISNDLLNLNTIKNPVNAYMFHVAGKIKKTWKKGIWNVFSDENDPLAIAFMPDKTYLFYSRSSSPDLNRFFSEYEIINAKYWNTAFNIEGDILWDSEINKNLYLIGDHNICGVEDAFISGMYAANKIILKS